MGPTFSAASLRATGASARGLVAPAPTPVIGRRVIPTTGRPQVAGMTPLGTGHWAAPMTAFNRAAPIVNRETLLPLNRETLKTLNRETLLPTNASSPGMPLTRTAPSLPTGRGATTEAAVRSDAIGSLLSFARMVMRCLLTR